MFATPRDPGFADEGACLEGWDVVGEVCQDFFIPVDLNVPLDIVEDTASCCAGAGSDVMLFMRDQVGSFVSRVRFTCIADRLCPLTPLNTVLTQETCSHVCPFVSLAPTQPISVRNGKRSTRAHIHVLAFVA